MIAEVALPLILAVFFQINALVIALMLAFLVAHEITGYYDLRLAMAVRQVNVFEHQVHSALEILPLAAIFLVMILIGVKAADRRLVRFWRGHGRFCSGMEAAARIGRASAACAGICCFCSCTVCGRILALRAARLIRKSGSYSALTAIRKDNAYRRYRRIWFCKARVASISETFSEISCQHAAVPSSPFSDKAAACARAAANAAAPCCFSSNSAIALSSFSSNPIPAGAALPKLALRFTDSHDKRLH